MQRFALCLADWLRRFLAWEDSEEDRKAWRWISEGSEFTIQPSPDEEFFGEQSGTKLILHLREEAQEYLDTGKLSDLLKKYSEFITFPIELWNEKVQYDQVVDESAPPPKEGEKPKMKSVPRSVYEWEVMNKMKPIWLRNPEVVNQSEYTEFYKTTFKAFDEPLTTTHFKVEGQIEFRALMFIPSTMPFELTRDMFSEGGRAMRLYVKRVFINDKFEDLIPRWLTFVRGVVDSEDLPLNVGREILQKSRTLKIIRKRLVRKVLDSIDDMREKQRSKYDQFWSNYGKYFKVGLVEDLDYKDELKRFVRFYSSKSGDNMTSLPEYLDRMQEGQDKIYFVTGEGKKAAEIAPAMEKMNKKGYEVLYMVDPLDEICSQSIVDFDGRKLVDINKAGLDLDKTEDEKTKFEQLTKEYEELAAWLKKQLGERVQKVEIGDRLVDSAATLVQGEWGMSPMMQRYMKSQTTSSSQDSAFAMGSRNQGCEGGPLSVLRGPGSATNVERPIADTYVKSCQSASTSYGTAQGLNARAYHDSWCGTRYSYLLFSVPCDTLDATLWLWPVHSDDTFPQAKLTGKTTISVSFVAEWMWAGITETGTSFSTSSSMSPVLAGSHELDMESEEGFPVGDAIGITGGGNSKTRDIASFGSIVLDVPLGYGYPAGSRITNLGGSYPSNIEISASEQADHEISAPEHQSDQNAELLKTMDCCFLPMATEDGSVPATEDRPRVKVHGIESTQLFNSTRMVLDSWHHADAQKAIRTLSQKDILVTNAKDKEINSKVISSLDRMIHSRHTLLI
ncbi:unnamed protein product [Prorocentrum cordatum]|uniref:Uncharacterized protein n=1 Tax=Prorocentrum cordatum TaxID=2364126 RepID=A0ABN9RXR6_9DINO|nr:unnamed protein product [Polarella glacialis]